MPAEDRKEPLQGSPSGAVRELSLSSMWLRGACFIPPDTVTTLASATWATPAGPWPGLASGSP